MSGLPPSGPPPSSRAPAPSAAFFVIALGRRTRELVDSRLAAHGLAFHHVGVLGHLHREPGLSYSELARRAGVSVQSMQSTVAHLEQERLIRRGVGAGQGRRADLTLTAAGRRVLATCEAEIRKVDDELLAGASAAERAQAVQVLSRLFRAGLTLSTVPADDHDDPGEVDPPAGRRRSTRGR